MLVTPLLQHISAVGQATLLLSGSLQTVVQGRLRGRETLNQMVRIGVDSVSMTLLLNAIAGAVLALQTANTFRQTGAENFVGGLVALAVVREMAPIFTALAVGARAGTAIASELGHMSVSNQLDALRILHVSETRYLVAPRVVACLLMLPVLTLLGEAAAVGLGMVTARTSAEIHPNLFLDSMWLTLQPYDVMASLVKAVCFGGLVALVSCTIGLGARGGSKQVGLAAMQSAIWVSILVLMANFLLTWLLFTLNNASAFGR